MKAHDILVIGLKHRVAAISRIDGRELWSTELSGGMGQGFVTLLSDGAQVFAYASGHLHCLDLATGRIIWTNEMPGYGYGLGSLALPNGQSAPNIPSVQAIMDADSAAASAASTTPS